MAALLHQSDGFEPIYIVAVLLEKGVTVTGFLICHGSLQTFVNQESGLGQSGCRGGIFIGRDL